MGGVVKTKNAPMALKHKINFIFLCDIGFPKLGEGVRPLGNFSHLIRFCSERIPYCNTSSQTMNLRISEKKLTESNMFETFFSFFLFLVGLKVDNIDLPEKFGK